MSQVSFNCIRVCLFVCKWEQFYMNRKALISRFAWPGLPFCARLNSKTCPDLDLSSRPCHYWLTNNQFFSLNIDIIVTVIHCHCSPSLSKLRISYFLAFPIWAKKEGQFQLQLLLYWYGLILRLAIDFSQAIKFQVKWPQAKLAHWAQKTR